MQIQTALQISAVFPFVTEDYVRGQSHVWQWSWGWRDLLSSLRVTAGDSCSLLGHAVFSFPKPNANTVRRQPFSYSGAEKSALWVFPTSRDGLRYFRLVRDGILHSYGSERSQRPSTVTWHVVEDSDSDFTAIWRRSVQILYINRDGWWRKSMDQDLEQPWDWKPGDRTRWKEMGYFSFDFTGL